MSPRKPKPGSLARSVRLVNREVLAHAFTHLDPSGYYVRELGGRESVPGLCLRVRASTVTFGHRRGGPFVAIAEARASMTAAEIDAARMLVKAALEEVRHQPTLARPRHGTMTVRELGDRYLQALEATRGDRRSPRTLEAYRELWRVHLVPLIGDRRLEDVAPDTVEEVKLEIPRRVQARQSPESGRPIAAKTGGRTVTNRALQQAEAAWAYALRMEWVTRNPWSERVVDRYDEEPDAHVLDAGAYAALGGALAAAEGALARPRPPLLMRSIAAIRVLLLTGARPSEVTQAVISPVHRFDPQGPGAHLVRS